MWPGVSRASTAWWEIVRAEAVERPEASAQLTEPGHAGRVVRLRAEAAVLLRFLDGHGAAQARRASHMRMWNISGHFIN